VTLERFMRVPAAHGPVYILYIFTKFDVSPFIIHLQRNSCPSVVHSSWPGLALARLWRKAAILHRVQKKNRAQNHVGTAFGIISWWCWINFQQTCRNPTIMAGHHKGHESPLLQKHWAWGLGFGLGVGLVFGIVTSVRLWSFFLRWRILGMADL